MNRIKFWALIASSLIPSYFGWLSLRNEQYIEMILWSAASYLLIYLAQQQGKIP